MDSTFPAGENFRYKNVILVVFSIVLLVAATLAVLKFPFLKNTISSSNEPHSRENVLNTGEAQKNDSPIAINNLARETNEEVFSIRQNYFVFFPVFPQPLLYVYEESSFTSDQAGERFIAPVGLALNIEVTNRKSTPTGIRAYAADLQMEDGTWSRIYSLPTDLEHTFYFDDGRNFEKCYRLEFEPNLLDATARSKVLALGEAITGWVFFEWSPELRENRKIRKLKLSIENAQGEVSFVVFDFLSNKANDSSGKSLAGKKGASDFHKGELRAKSKNSFEDLSKLPVRSFRNE